MVHQLEPRGCRLLVRRKPDFSSWIEVTEAPDFLAAFAHETLQSFAISQFGIDYDRSKTGEQMVTIEVAGLAIPRPLKAKEDPLRIVIGFAGREMHEPEITVEISLAKFLMAHIDDSMFELELCEVPAFQARAAAVTAALRSLADKFESAASRRLPYVRSET